MKALSNTGTPNGQSTALHGKKPIDVANIAIAQVMPELKINGIANVVFNTRGKPNTTGSEIPHSAGTKPSFAIIFESSLFDTRKIAKISDKIQPAPPGTTKFNQKPYVTGWLATPPAFTAVMFAAIAEAIRGFLIGEITRPP